MLWYEKYGFKENPFDIRKLSSELQGEKNPIETLSNAIEEGSISQLYGEVGTGKTSILKFLESSLKKKYKTIYINCELLSGQQGIDFEKIFLNKSILSKILSKPKVILLDEIHALPPYIVDNIKGLWDSEKGIKSIVLAQVSEDLTRNCSEPFISRINLKIQTSKPSVEENIKIVKERVENKNIFSEELLKIIVNDCLMNPRKVLLTCAEVCKQFDGDIPIEVKDYKKIRIEEQKKEEEVKEDVKEQKVILSQTQKQIADFLRSGGKTLEQLSTTMNMQQGAMGTQLQRMKKKGAILIIKKENEPTIYKLDESYRLSTIKDGVK